MLKKNNKGFTMVEILGAVVIIGVLTLIAVPAVSKMMKQFREDYYMSLEDTITSSAKEFFTDNRIYRPEGLLRSSYVNVSELIEKKYADNLLDYKGNSCSLEDRESYVVAIYRGEDSYEYKACIKCKGDDYTSDAVDYCDPAWLTNNNIEYDFGTSEDLYIYYNTSRDVIREKLMRTLNIVKYNDDGDELDRVLAEDSEEEVLPTNIDELDTTPILDADNKKEFILTYEDRNTTNPNDVMELKAIVYKHKAPTITIKKTSNNEEYELGTWSNGVIITLKTNDNFYELSGTSVGSFQWYIDGGWKDIPCSMTSSNSCSVAIKENVNDNYRFRIVTNEGNVSDETGDYLIKVDVDKPTVVIDPNGSEPIVKVGTTSANIIFKLTTADTGGSGIKTRKYAISTNGSSAPTSYTNFTSNTLNVNRNMAGNKYYVWAQVEDNAGNISIGVYPSKAFHMKYEIKYNMNGGSGGPTTEYKMHGEKLTLSTTKPTKTGYDFVGWSTTSNGTSATYNAGGTYSTDKAVTLYAVWKAKNYTVTFNANGGSVSPNSKTVTYNSTYGTLPTPTRTGYTFNGWYTSSSGGTKISSSSKVTITSNQTLYAHWTINSYTVTFNANGGSVSPSSTKANYNTNITLPTPTRANYKFDGWYTSSSGGTRVGGGGNSYKVTGNTTLYAHWTANTYTITFNANGGSGGPSTQTKRPGVNLTLTTSKPTRSGYEFMGWSTTKNSTTINYKSGSIYSKDQSITLYAVWRKQITVTFNYNKALWNGTSTTRSCYIYNNQTSCTITSPGIANLNQTNFRGDSTDASLSAKGNQSFSTLFTIKGWNTSSSATTASLATNKSLSVSSNRTYYAIVIINYSRFLAFPNAQWGLYCRKYVDQPYSPTKNMAGMIATNYGIPAYFKTTTWEYSTSSGKLWLRGSLENSSLCTPSVANIVNPTCSNQWVPAEWVSW